MFTPLEPCKLTLGPSSPELDFPDRPADSIDRQIIIAMVDDATDCAHVLHQGSFPWGFFEKSLTFAPMGTEHGADDLRHTGGIGNEFSIVRSVVRLPGQHRHPERCLQLDLSCRYALLYLCFDQHRRVVECQDDRNSPSTSPCSGPRVTPP